MKTQENTTFLNYAKPVLDEKGRVLIRDLSNYECCTEQVAFVMKDNIHSFEVGLKTIISLIEIAQTEKAIPPLPDDWWITVLNMD